MTTSIVVRLLDRSAVYGLLTRMTRCDEYRARLSHDHVRPTPRQNVLDLGCGVGAAAADLGCGGYHGLESNAMYVAWARHRLTEHCTFTVGHVVCDGERYS